MNIKEKKLWESIPGWDEFINDFKPNVTHEKKQQLLQMAKNGEPRPPQSGGCALAAALSTYTNKNNGSYDFDFDKKIRKLRPDWFVSRADIANKKKQQLLQMAKKGKSRPAQTTRPSETARLGAALCAYTNKSNVSYDAKFNKQIRKLRPDWFISQSDVANKKKQQLLQMAKKGKSRPVCKTPLGAALMGYISKGGTSYDSSFDKEIRKLRPDWFVSRVHMANEKKQQLLLMAKNGEAKPHHKNHPLGNVLFFYTNKNSDSYDAKFDKQIRKLKPNWFVFQSDLANKKKQELLQIAKKGEPRPPTNTSIGRCLCHYVSIVDGCYDPSFNKEIRKLRPDWFVSSSASKKQQLLQMAKKGEARPNYRCHSLGSSLSSYTLKSNKTNYDASFDKEIRKLRPDWFISQSDLANKKKQQLLQMARKNQNRPNQQTTLGKALCSYTGKSRTSYNASFDKKIRKLRPDWFKKR